MKVTVIETLKQFADCVETMDDEEFYSFLASFSAQMSSQCTVLVKHVDRLRKECIARTGPHACHITVETDAVTSVIAALETVKGLAGMAVAYHNDQKEKTEATHH